MICYFCHWGWPVPVANIYLKALHDLGGDDMPLKYGPAHIVWADENWDSAGWCLEHFDEYTDGYTDEQMDVVRRSLEELAGLSSELWDVIPDDYDGMHPEDYPPGVEMVRV